MARNSADLAPAKHPSPRRGNRTGGDPGTGEAHEPMAHAATLLRSASLRVTAQRIAVLAAVQELPGHPDVEAIKARAQQITGRLSLQSAYNVLHTLTDAALVRPIHLPGHPARYEIERHDNHHHFACRTCGHIINVDCIIGAAPCLTADLPDTYQIDEAAVTFRGICPECAAARSTAQPSPAPDR